VTLGRPAVAAGPAADQAVQAASTGRRAPFPRRRSTLFGSPQPLRALAENPDVTEAKLNSEPIDHADAKLPSEANDPMEAKDPAEPIDRIDPAEPIDRIDPVEPIDRIDPLEPIDRIEPPALPAPGTPRFFMIRLWHGQLPARDGRKPGGASRSGAGRVGRPVQDRIPIWVAARWPRPKSMRRVLPHRAHQRHA
jgi:hypothetical protein